MQGASDIHICKNDTLCTYVDMLCTCTVICNLQLCTYNCFKVVFCHNVSSLHTAGIRTYLPTVVTCFSSHLPSFCRNDLHSSLLLQAAKLCDSAADGLTRQEVTVFMSYLSHDGESNDWSNPKPFHEARNPVDTSMLCCCLMYSCCLIEDS